MEFLMNITRNMVLEDMVFTELPINSLQKKHVVC